METKGESTEGKGKLTTYVRWFFVGAFGLIILFTVIMAAYRRSGASEGQSPSVVQRALIDPLKTFHSSEYFSVRSNL